MERSPLRGEQLVPLALEYQRSACQADHSRLLRNFGRWGLPGLPLRDLGAPPVCPGVSGKSITIGASGSSVAADADGSACSPRSFRPVGESVAVPGVSAVSDGDAIAGD